LSREWATRCMAPASPVFAGQARSHVRQFLEIAQDSCSHPNCVTSKSSGAPVGTGVPSFTGKAGSHTALVVVEIPTTEQAADHFQGEPTVGKESGLLGTAAGVMRALPGKLALPDIHQSLCPIHTAFP